jgi:hypothetical protein
MNRQLVGSIYVKFSITIAHFVAVMCVNRSAQNVQSLLKTLHKWFLPTVGSFEQVVSKENIFRNWSIRKTNGLWRPCLLTDRDKISHYSKELYIDASYQDSVHFPKGFQMRRLFRNRPIKFLKIFSFETTCSNEPTVGRNHLCKVFNSDCTFCADLLTHMTATDNLCFW